MDGPRDGSRFSRRQFLTAATAGTALGIAGCLDLLADEMDDVEFIPDGPAVGLQLVADGFTYPTDMVEVPDGSGRLFVTDQVGVVYSVDKTNGDVVEAADLTDRVNDVEGGFSERGLLGIACHPEFAANGRLFVRYSGDRRPGEPSNWHTEILSEFAGDAESIDPESEREILRIPQPHVVHQGGSVLFGPAGYLYTTTGDGGDVFDDHEPSWYEANAGMGAHSQTTTDNLLGGVLRIDVDDEAGDRPYAIPDDNPLVDLEGHLDEYYAWGMRNPWGASFDGDDLYVADVGQARFEIVNRVEKGGNYGWNIREGTHCYDEDASRDPPEECPDATPEEVRGGEALLDPLIEYPQYHPIGEVGEGRFDTSTQYGSAVIGGHVYRGSVEALEGTYVFGDWSKEPHGDPRGQLFMAQPRDEFDEVHAYFEALDLWAIRRIRIASSNDIAVNDGLNRYVASIGADLDGEVYVLVTETNEIIGETGELRRIVPA